MLGTAFYTELQDTKDLENFINYLKTLGLKGKTVILKKDPEKNFFTASRLHLVIVGDKKCEVKAYRLDPLEKMRKENSEVRIRKLNRLIEKLNETIIEEETTSLEVTGPITASDIKQIISVCSKRNVTVYSKLLKKKIFVSEDKDPGKGEDFLNLTPEEFAKLGLILTATEAEIISID